MGRRRWRIAMLLGVGVLVNYFDRVNISVAHDALHREFGISTVMFGYLLSSFNWTYALLQLPMGVLLDRFGVRPIGTRERPALDAGVPGCGRRAQFGNFFWDTAATWHRRSSDVSRKRKSNRLLVSTTERSLATAIFDAAAKLGAAIGIPAVGFVLIHFGWRASFAATGS